MLNPAGIYFGTRSGQLWGSRDGGASWALAASGLPPIVCVKSAVVGAPARAGARRAPKKSSAATRRARPRNASKPAARATTKPRRAAARAARIPQARTKKK